MRRCLLLPLFASVSLLILCTVVTESTEHANSGPVNARAIESLSASPDTPSAAEFRIRTPVTRLALGSCNRQYLAQDIWQSIIEYSPDLWLWLGDVVYTDRMIFPGVFRASPVPEIERMYSRQKHSPLYSQLQKSTPIIGTWDDHDFGQNNGDRHFGNKGAVKQIFLKFIDELHSSPRWDREGLYTSYLIPISAGPSSASSYQVKLILLDNRYNLDRPTADILGAAQWAWLQAQLLDPAADLLLIASGIQFLPRDKPIQEKWFELRASFDRLLDLLRDASAPAVLLSGDVHHGDLLRSDCSGVGYPLYELTSSGLTHCLRRQSGPFHPIVKRVLHSSEALFEPFTLQNFGSIEFSASSQDLLFTLQLRDQHGAVAREVHLSLETLRESRFTSGSSSTTTPRVDLCATPALWKQVDHDQARVFAGLLTLLFVALAVSLIRSLVARCVGRVPHTEKLD